jgi:hypothetical protein
MFISVLQRALMLLMVSFIETVYGAHALRTSSNRVLFLCIGKRVGYNNMIYDETEIERIARVAGEFQ